MSAWIPPGLPARLQAAQAALDRRIAEQMPACSDHWTQRSSALAPGGDRTAYFLDVAAFPTLVLPHWLAPEAPPALHGALLESSLAGYWAIRVVDQLTDEARPEDAHLAPLLGLLHHRFWWPYHRLFGAAEGAFWAPALRWWCQSADAAVAESTATDDALRTLGWAKTGAVHIPLLALALQAEPGAGLPPAWQALVASLSQLHQLHNDWTDWLRDRSAGHRTWVHAWAEAHCGAADPAVWWALEGATRFATTELEPAAARLDDAFRAAGAAGGVDWTAARLGGIRTQASQVAAAGTRLRALLGG